MITPTPEAQGSEAPTGPRRFDIATPESTPRLLPVRQEIKDESDSDGDVPPGFAPPVRSYSRTEARSSQDSMPEEEEESDAKTESLEGDDPYYDADEGDTWQAYATNYKDAGFLDDLYVLESTWSRLPEAHKWASSTPSFSFVRDFDNKILDITNTCTGPVTNSVLYLDTTWHQHATLDDVLRDIATYPKAMQTSMLAAVNLNFGSASTYASIPTPKTMAAPRRAKAARREATITEKRQYAKQFHQAKLDEYKAWSKENDIFELVDMRKEKVQNYVTGRWVLTVKRDKDGNFQKCKARWVLRGFQDRQVWDLQTDSPTSTRPGFRLQCQAAANRQWDVTHVDLKTAFLQGDSFVGDRNVICQLPPEAGHPPHIGARLKRAAYGLNDAPRLWWNRPDKALRTYGLVPTRADRCCYVLYSAGQKTTKYSSAASSAPDTAIWEAKLSTTR